MKSVDLNPLLWQTTTFGYGGDSPPPPTSSSPSAAVATTRREVEVRTERNFSTSLLDWRTRRRRQEARTRETRAFSTFFVDIVENTTVGRKSLD